MRERDEANAEKDAVISKLQDITIERDAALCQVDELKKEKDDALSKVSEIYFCLSPNTILSTSRLFPG